MSVGRQKFANRLLVAVEGEQRAELTRRYYALGHTDTSRLLFIVFTIHDDLRRVISALPMSRQEQLEIACERHIGVGDSMTGIQGPYGATSTPKG